MQPYDDGQLPRRPLAVPRILLWASDRLSRLSRRAVWLVALAALATIGLLDVVTGSQLAFSVFYVIPVIAAAWHLGWRASLVVVVLAGVVWLGSDLVSGRGYDHELVRYWNAVVRASLFFIVAFTIALLRQALAKERELARTDALTGLTNVRSFSEIAARELTRLRRAGLPLSIAFIDVDDFKAVNDTLGHAAGDALLKALAGAIRGAVREIDIVARMGGDEFVVLLPEATQDGARIVVGRMIERLEAAAAAGDWPVGFSAGVVTFASAPDSTDTILRAADQAMYAVKHAGGRAVRYDQH